MEEKSVTLNKNKFRLSGDGVFYSLQGEGMTMGYPCVFVRLHLCNLQCSWCDTPYTWNRDMDEFWTESYELTVNQLIKEIEKAWALKHDKIRVVFTGGEPLLQQDLIIEVMDKKSHWFYEIETNGTLMPNDQLLLDAQFNCSPKLKNSDNPEQVRIREKPLKAINKAKSQFKFVVKDTNDVLEMERDFIEPFNLYKHKIVLMPLGITTNDLNAHALNVVEAAKKRGYRLLGRLQIDIWGSKRKV